MKNQNDTLPNTYFARAQADADLEAQGRFKKQVESPVTAIPQVPMQPASSYWHDNPVPSEPPLGFDVNAMTPIGTAAEVERSIRELEARTLLDKDGSDD